MLARKGLRRITASSSLEEMTMSNARDIWDQTFGKGMSEDAAMLRVLQYVQKMNELEGNESTRRSDTVRLTFAVLWLHNACTSLTTTHKFAAALCASASKGIDIARDIKLPSPAFRVRVPNGVLDAPEHGIEVSHVDVEFLSNGDSMYSVHGSGPMIESRREPGTFSRRVLCLPVMFSRASEVERARLVESADEFLYQPTDLFGGDESESVFDLSPEAASQLSQAEVDVRRRIVLMARRLVIGLLLTFTHTPDWKSKVAVGTGAVRRNGPPPHRNIFIGRPISLDARPAVAQYISGAKSSAPSVQSLVRGHYKRQVIGVSRAGRKVIWIEPYWRGPEDAPILARPYQVGGAANKAMPSGSNPGGGK